MQLIHCKITQLQSAIITDVPVCVWVVHIRFPIHSFCKGACFCELRFLCSFMTCYFLTTDEAAEAEKMLSCFWDNIKFPRASSYICNLRTRPISICSNVSAACQKCSVENILNKASVCYGEKKKHICLSSLLKNLPSRIFSTCCPQNVSFRV